MMMNRFKRFLSLICALSMLISIAGSYADPNEGDRPDLPAVTEPASEPETAPAEEPPQEHEANEADEANDPEGDDPSDTDPSDEDPSDEEPSGQEEPSGSEESSEDDSQPGGEPAADQQKEHSDEEKPSEEEKTSGDKRNDPKPYESKTDESQPDGSKQEDENQTPASEGEEKQASGSGNGENRESSDQTGTDHPSDADSAATQTAGQETPDSSAGSGTAEQGSLAENEAENKDAQISEQSVSDQNASSQNVSDQNPSGQNTPGQENAVQDTPSDPDENLNEAEESEDDPEENEEDQTGLNVLEIGGSVKKGTVVPDEPVRLVMRSERTETILLTVILAAEDEIRLAVNSRELSFAESTVDEENGEQTLIYPMEAKAGNAYLLEIAADKETGFSIQAAYREEEVPKEEEPSEGEGSKEQTEVQKDDSSDENAEKSKDSEDKKVNQPAKDGQPAAEGDHPADHPAADEANGAEADAVPLSEGGTLIAPGSDYTVTVQYGADALFPVNVTLSVTEIHPWDARYAEMTGITEEMLTDDWSEAGDFQRVFDITFRSGETEIEPAAPIQVDIQFHDPVMLEENSSLQVVHVDHENNAEIVPNDTSAAPAEGNSAVEVEGVSFTSDSFSTYIVFQKKEVVSKTIESEDHSVAITYGRENRIPANSRVSVTEIAEGTEAYETFRQQLIRQLNLDETKQTVLFSALYDITILDEHSNEVTIQDNTTVTVTAELPADTARQEDLLVVHFEDNGEGANELSAATENNTVTFETDGFSVYGFAYTVDYTFENREYHMQGETSMLLSELFEKLGIDAEARNVLQVSFTDDSLLSVEKTEDDWLLTSLKPFTSHETLTVTMNNGTVYVVAVTDAQTTSTNLSDYMTAATIILDGVEQTGDTWEVKPYTNYDIKLSFAESEALQFVNDNTALTYQLPAGITLNPGEQSGGITITVDGQHAVAGNIFSVTPTGLVTFSFNQNDPNFNKLIQSGTTRFNLSFSGQFNSSQSSISFKDDITKTVSVDDTHHAAVTEKNGNYNPQTGKMEYTVRVSSDGVSKNVHVQDIISGKILSMDQDSLNLISNKKSSVEHTGGATTNGYDLTIPTMEHGEVITITYTASIDYTKASDPGKFTTDDTNNTVTVSADDDSNQDDQTKTKNFEYVTYSSIGKQANQGNITTDENGNKVVPWTLTVNNEAAVSLGGSTIKDTLDASCIDYTSYSSPITIKVYKKNYTDQWNFSYELVRTDTLNVSSGDKTWTYQVPETDTEAYEYVAEYNTVVKTSGLLQDVTIKNTGEGRPGSATGQVTVGPDEDDKVSGSKRATSYDENEANWEISVHVPAAGYNSLIVTDTVPNIWANNKKLYDEFKEGSLTVSGLDSSESYTYQYHQDSDQHQLVITFYKDQQHAQTGLNSTEESRDLSISFTTTTNSEWAEAGYNNKDAYFSTHTNNATIRANDISVTTQASFQLLKSSIQKETNNDGGNGDLWVDGTVKHIYFYMITLEGVASDTVSVDDIVDKTLLSIHPAIDPNSNNTDYRLYRHLRISADRYLSKEKLNDSNPVTVTETENGYRFTATVPKTTGGAYYSTYYLWYAMIPADGAVAEVLENGGAITIPNTAQFNGKSSQTVNVEFDYKPIKKTLLTEDWKINNGVRDLTYQIVFNEQKNTIGNKDTLIITDTFEHMSVDYASIQYTTDPAAAAAEITYDVSGNVMTFIVPNQTKVTITYNAKVVGSGSVNVKNTARFDTFEDIIDKTGTYTAGGSGEAETYRINLAKYAKINGTGHMEIKVAGAVFELLDSDRSPIKVNGNPVTFTTGTDGKVVIFRDGVIFYPNHQYYLHEISAPDGFERDDTYYGFKFGTDADYDHYIYFNNDTLKVYNEKILTSLQIEKAFEGDENLTDEQKNQIQFSIVPPEKAEESERYNGPAVVHYSDFTDGKYLLKEGMTLADGKELILPVGVYTITESSQTMDGYEVTTTYQVNGGDSQTGNTASANVINAQKTVVAFHNQYAEKTGDLKIRKKTAVNGTEVTTGNLADGTYSFTIAGTGNNQSIQKTVTIQIANSNVSAVGGDGRLADGAALVSGLPAGDYIVTESTPTNGTVLMRAEGGKSVSDAKAVTVTVEPGITGNSVKSTGTAIFTNNREYTSVEVEKTWVRNDGSETWPSGAEITVELMADNQTTGKTITLSQNKPKDKFENLLKLDHSGHEISYSVKEISVDHFTSTASELKDGKITITNTEHKGTLKVKKAVTGEKAKTSGFKFTVQDSSNNYYDSNGNNRGTTRVEMTVSDGGTAEVLNLPMGTYTVTELGINQYEAEDGVKVLGYTLVAAESQTGSLTTDGQVAEVTLTNDYTAKEGKARIQGTKIYDKAFDAGEFTFEMIEVDQAGKPVSGATTVTAAAAASGSTAGNDGKFSGTFRFNEITYHRTGTYYYKVTERKGDKDYIHYDTHSYMVSVNVVDEGDGHTGLTTTVTYPEGGLRFINTYSAKGSIALEAKKTLNGRKLEANDFEFVLLDSEKQVIQTNKKNDASGKVTFGEIEYSLEDLSPSPIQYYIQEVIPGDAVSANDSNTSYTSASDKTGKFKKNGMTYDGREIAVTVTLKDNGDGTITATASYGTAPTNYSLANEFINEYASSGSLRLTAEKTLDSGKPTGKNFSFTLTRTDASGNALTGDQAYQDTKNNDAEGKITFQTIQFDRSVFDNDLQMEKTIYYQIIENDPSDSGIIYDKHPELITVTLKDDGKGKILATPNKNGASIRFNNTSVQAAKASLQVTKNLTGRELKDGEFSFTLTAKTEGDPNLTGANSANPIQTKTNTGALVPFDELNYSAEALGNAEQKDFTYEIAEVVPADAKNADGKTWNETNGQSGPYAKNGVTYDGKTITATVTVSKNGDSLSTSVSYSDNDSTDRNDQIFRNTYDAKGSAVIEATKTLTGKDLEAKQFSFNLTGDKITTAQTKQNDEGPNAVDRIVFDPIEYTLADLDHAKSKVFTYSIKEVLTNQISGIVYDEHEETVTVTVTDQGNGSLKTEVQYDTDGATFTNRYETTPVDVSFSGTKTLEGAALKENQFSFLLSRVSAKESAEPGAKDIPDANQNQTKYNKAGGTIQFDALHYDHPGVYTYQIRETSENGKGITADSTVYTLKVTVSDNGAGQLTAGKVLTCQKDGNTITLADDLAVAAFVNTYSAKGETVIEARKELEGKELKKDQFEFRLKPVSATATDGTTPLTDPNTEKTAKNDADGKVVFTPLSYTTPGTYVYEMAENGANGKGITIDKTVYQVTVRVYDQNDGTLGTEVSYKNLKTNQNTVAPVTFKNSYTTEDTEDSLEAEKKLTDRNGKALNLNGRTFSFSMELVSAKDGTADRTAVAPASRTAMNDTNGKIKFEKLTFTKPGVYQYAVTETTDSGNGITKDSSAYTVTYTVRDDGEGKLQLTRNIRKGQDPAGQILFTNQYSTDSASADVNARKDITGRALKAYEFTFSLEKQSAVGPDGTTAITDSNEDQLVVLNELDGRIPFKTLQYSEPGTYTYRMWEVTANRADLNTDSTQFTVIVRVTDDGSGHLSAATEYRKGDQTVTEAEVRFVNEYISGSLELTKQVTGNTVGDAERAKEFTFTILLKDAEDKNVSETFIAVRTAADQTTANESVTFKNGTASVKLKHQEKLRINGLPNGASYTISEMNAEGYELKQFTGSAGTIQTGAVKQAEAVNEHNTYGSLLLKKALTGNDTDPKKAFKVRVTLYQSNGSVDTDVDGRTYGDAVFHGGVSEPIEITAAGTRLITNLPNGDQYTVEELDETGNVLTTGTTDHYTLKSIVCSPDTNAVISSAAQQTAVITNERNSYGGLSVQKQVAGNASTQIQNFEFTVTLGPDQNGQLINGTYEDMFFKDGVAKFTLANNEKKAAYGLPNGITYQVAEKDYTGDGYVTVSRYEKGQIKGNPEHSTQEAAQTAHYVAETNRAAFTNTRNANGTLSVTKKVEGNLGEKDKSFTIAITLGGTEELNEVQCTGSMSFDNETRTLTATLKGGETASATGIPNGTPFSISESGADDYQILYQVNGKTGQTGVIDEKNENKVTVTNTKNGYGGLKIIKRTAGNDPNKKTWFAFKVTLSEPLTGIYGEIRFENGVSAGPADTQGDPDYTNGKVPAGYFKVKTTDSVSGSEGKQGAVVITGLPAGITYTVQEDDYSGLYDKYTFTHGSGKIASVSDKPEMTADQIQEENTVTCVNTRDRWGKLVIRKAVKGQPLDPDQKFSFTVQINQIKDRDRVGLNGTFDGVTFANGSGQVILAAGEEKVMTGLPLFSTFEVTEADAPVEGYTWTQEYSLSYMEENAEGVKEEITKPNTASGTILEDERIVTFTNTYERPAIEKYVDKKVHSDLPAFDTAFVYDILAYITVDADSAEIYDTLDSEIPGQNALVFVSTADQVEVVDLGETVDHTVQGSVMNRGTAIAESAGVTRTISGKTLTVRINDAGSLRGHWVKVTYTAQIDQNAIRSLTDYDAVKLTIDQNTPVLGGEEPHIGIANTASYQVWVGHKGGSSSGTSPKYKEKSNTVTITPPVTRLSFLKKWTDDQGTEVNWPEGITVTVTLIGIKKGEEPQAVSGVAPVILSSGQTEGFFADLPVYEKLTYGLTEKVNGMDPRAYDLTMTRDPASTPGEQKYTLTNQLMETSASVMKLWLDDGNADGARPVSLTVKLLADGAVLQTVTLSENNQWRTTVEHLPAKTADRARDIVYTWEETEPAGYELSGIMKQGEVTVLINTRTPERVTIPVRKVWADNANQARLEAVTVQLFANGIARGEAIRLNAANNWQSAWTGLPKAEGGAAIRYTVEEIDVPEGYEAAVSGNAETGFTVTNTLQRGGIRIEKEFKLEIPEIRPEEEPEYREITVSKVWADQDNRDGNRPDSVTVRLYAGGTEVAAAQITEAEGWQHTFYGLPARADNGRRIHYSVSEDAVPLYVSAVNGFTITNTYRPETTAAAVTKIWNDRGNEMNLRPESVRVSLSNGQETVAHAVLSEENGWSAAVSGLPTVVNGREAEYTWTEEPVIGYDQESVTKQGSRTIITNKVWEREVISENRKPKRVPGNTFYIFEDYETPLGVEIMINHVGDCFD